ncbi:catabolite repression HPr-like protein [Acetitomaculum ruminis DSM 5522]|uniref:Catabolite repression HPr-like protein n=1 Tax=Acetitomaculum ruminis DSM 5522 TaxID=1120918 RepID=A0A1I0XBN4_9FIRM|nr:HPr family phosphocarrier protein [Acetitomaculum ruminis]SFA98087.1 catabolite repression HPr-like protein [Acetitomaculum ruminis DSM 5522]
MIKKSIDVNITADSQDRPAAVLVQIASQYDSKIYIELDNKKVNAKSIMGMMTIFFNKGERLVVSADGDDEERAFNDIEKFLTKA